MNVRSDFLVCLQHMIRYRLSYFPAVAGMPLSEGFIRRKGIDAPRVNHEAENCYKTFKIGRNSIICRPKEDNFDG